ncbi:Receptor-like protein 12 [Morus notabilis]|uniref:Receptor-like protein 12 n=1 Tax=Morus notabilis TaxID=981085 RepID=W9QHZ3_9ROSA|nr:Receptor-like protein 12 [Morus notabilis]
MLINKTAHEANLTFQENDQTIITFVLSCHDDERLALLQFKQSFVIEKLASSYEGAYPKVLSWKAQGGSSNCCSWDGVECDEKTGHVIGLILNSSCLYASINSSSSLFHLVHLQKLNLADNNFSYSLIPSAIGQFLGLTYLNLSDSRFYGQIPTEISRLSKLTFLDLSSHFDPFTSYYPLLVLNYPSLRSLVQNLTSLEWLRLTSVHIPSTVPDFLANFTSLKAIFLQNCGLYGEFPKNIFHLPNLKILKLGWNKDLTGYLPEFHQRSPLEGLELSETSFSGCIPPSIEKLESLEWLYLRGCNFSRPLPSSLGKLSKLIDLDIGVSHLGGPIPSWLGNLSQLVRLYLDNNNLDGSIPSWFGALTQLNHLNLKFNNLNGYIPSSFQNLSQLGYLSVYDNHLTGPIPSSFGNLTQLFYIDLARNELCGSVPHSLYKLMNLETLYLYDNKLTGTLEFDLFFTMRSLVDLSLSGNTLSLFFHQRNINATTSKFTGLGLRSCNLSEFPNFLRHQNKLEWLNLSRNKIHGHIPKWMWNTSLETLTFLFLNDNFLVDFPHPSPIFLPWVNLWALDLSFNLLQGQLPIAPTWMCDLSSLWLLDLSSNNLSGTVPQCLGKLNSLSVLNLRNNSFGGTIPQVCALPSNLKMIDLSKNKFKGQLARSMAACTKLEYFDVEKNQLTDIFPAWLGTLPELKFLSLRHNRFYGFIKKPKQKFLFAKLRVMDLSYNNFTGKLPFQYMLIWSGMKAINNTDSRYMKETQISHPPRTNISQSFNYYFSTTIVNKGQERNYPVILESFAGIDFSCNKFNGEIPQLVGNLVALRSLNLSFNNLTGSIPSSLGNLTELESLDLSNNKLSGEIPPQLTRLTFLQSFDVSRNNLRGPIPQANQFGNMDNTSFEGNPGLCGNPLSKKCGDSKALPLPPSIVEEGDDSKSSIELDWKFVLAGCICGFVVGVALGDLLSCHDDERLALLQFKQSFVIEKLASSYEGAYPKVLSWKAQGGSSNCCSWDGVECDEKTGHVIGLILNSSCLYGSINSSSSLFHLVHLQKLNLADNNFSYSLIPSAIGQFLGLTYLNLSDSWFYGQIPSEISHLSKLTFLDLSSHFNEIDPSNPLLELKNPSLRSLVQNLTSLEWLRLSSVHIPSTVHDFLANFTSLKAIILQNCGLYGEFPNNIFHLPNLKILALGWNKDLTGYLPEFHQRSPLEGLVLSETSFSGCIPPSIEKLESLEGLYLRGCNFSRPLPSSLGKLSKLIDLDLRANHLGGPIPSWLGNLSQLVRLYLDNNNLDGYIPSFQNLSQLGLLSLRDNHLTGPIPSSFGNLTQLFAVYLEGNELCG